MLFKRRNFLALSISIFLPFIFSCSWIYDDGKEKLAKKLCKKRYAAYEIKLYTNPTTGKVSECQDYYITACTEEGLEKLIKHEERCGPTTTQSEYFQWLKCMQNQEAEYYVILKTECPTLYNPGDTWKY